jgi:hypothetical protein
MCVCICMYVSTWNFTCCFLLAISTTCTKTHACMYACLFPHVHDSYHAFLYIYIHTHTCVCMYIYIYIFFQVHSIFVVQARDIYTHIYIYIHTHIHTYFVPGYIHMHMHIHIHTYSVQGYMLHSELDAETRDVHTYAYAHTHTYILCRATCFTLILLWRTKTGKLWGTAALKGTYVFCSSNVLVYAWDVKLWDTGTLRSVYLFCSNVPCVCVMGSYGTLPPWEVWMCLVDACVFMYVHTHVHTSIHLYEVLSHIWHTQNLHTYIHTYIHEILIHIWFMQNRRLFHASWFTQLQFHKPGRRRGR